MDGSKLARTFFTCAALVGAAMCSAFERGSHDRWPSAGGDFYVVALDHKGQLIAAVACFSLISIERSILRRSALDAATQH